MRLEDRRLKHIRPLSGLNKVARELEIPLTLFGGVASRAAIQLTHRPYKRLDLFDLAPFSSDIDLEYEAGPERGPEVMAAIQSHVPFASWFRWSLVDEERAAKAAAQRAISTVVPLRTIRFSTDAPAMISADAQGDLESGRVSFWRNPAFRRDGVDGAARDVELFGLMMALNAEADVQSWREKAPGVDRRLALDWLQSDGWRDLEAILEDDRLRGRFWTMYATRRVLGDGGGEVFKELTLLADRMGIFTRLGHNPDDPSAPIGLSKLSRGGQFRAGELKPNVITGDDARTSFVSVLNDVLGGLGLRRRIRSPEELIDPSLELVAVAPFIRIEKLPDERDDSRSLDAFESGIDDEFIQLAWPHQGGATHARGLTAQLFTYGQKRSSNAFSSVPAVGGIQGNQAWIRIRLDDLKEPENERTENMAALVILQARHG